MKSPTGATQKASPLSAVGIKKPLSTVKKSPITSTPAATVTKKSPTKLSSVKKTTTTTTAVVQKKKVVNGDIVAEETTTTKTTSGDPQLIPEGLNGHFNGHSIAENGAGKGVQMVLDSAAD